GRLWEGLHTFEDMGDAGTEYMFMPPLNQEVVRSDDAMADVRIIRQDSLTQCVRITIALDIPHGVDYAGDRRAQQTLPHVIESRLTLNPGSPMLEVTTRFDNMAENHRLRAAFPID